MHVNVRFEGMSSEPVLLPFWIMAYRYKDTVYRFLLNGQTGKATGTAPTSLMKIGAVIAIGVAAPVLLGLVFVCAGAIVAQ